MKNWIRTIDIGHSDVLVTRYWDDEKEDAPWVIEAYVGASKA